MDSSKHDGLRQDIEGKLTAVLAEQADHFDIPRTTDLLVRLYSDRFDRLVSIDALSTATVLALLASTMHCPNAPAAIAATAAAPATRKDKW